jgi:hypothetical protein
MSTMSRLIEHILIQEQDPIALEEKLEDTFRNLPNTIEDVISKPPNR